MRVEKAVGIIGAGLAGSEAAWHLAEQGIGVDLYEMRPTKMTCLLYTSPSPRDATLSRMPSSA